MTKNAVKKRHVGGENKKSQPAEKKTLSAGLSAHNLKKLAALLFSVSFVAHFVRLGHPTSVVFDEVHFGKFTSQYCCEHENFFDIHPPHAKLLVAASAYLGGYRGGFTFERIGQKYESTSYLGFRALPALMGTVVGPLIFFILLQLGVNWRAAFLGGALAVFDNALLVQTRILALDGVLVVATLLTVSCLLGALKRERSYVLFALAGACAAFAVGTKFTGLVTLGLMLLATGRRFFEPKVKQRAVHIVAELSVGVCCFLVVYLAGWWIHFQLLTLAGNGDAFYKNSGNFFTDVSRLHSVMFAANNGIRKSHADTSPWWTWPFMLKPIYYWVEGKAQIYFLGNPVTWFGATFVALFAMLELLTQKLTKKTKLRSWWIVGAAFWASLIPYAAVSRGLFLYHYLPTLQFAILAAGFAFDGWMKALSPERARSFFYGVLIVTVAGFLLVSPLTFGFVAGEIHRVLLKAFFPKLFLA